MTKINKWRIYCNDESDWTIGYLDADVGEPTKCFNDTSHSVNPLSITLVDVMTENKVTIKEEDIPTGGHFVANCLKLDCPVGYSTHDFQYPHPISTLSITFETLSEHRDDEIEIIIAPETVVGEITSDVSTSDTIINVSQTVIDNASLGYHLCLEDGTNHNELGKIISIDKILNQLTIQNSSTNTYLTSTPTNVKLCHKVVEDFTIGYPSRYELGKDKIGGSHVPTNKIIRVKYKNNGDSTKKLYSVIEFLY